MFCFFVCEYIIASMWRFFCDIVTLLKEFFIKKSNHNFCAASAGFILCYNYLFIYPFLKFRNM